MVVSRTNGILISVVALLAGAISIVWIAFSFVSVAHTVSHNGLVVVVDAGHGGRDGGVVGSVTGVTEAEINLLIALQLEKILIERGYKVIMTRRDSNGLYGNAQHNRKLADMRERERIIEEATPDLVVSIHQNSYPRRALLGAQVFYSIGGEPHIAMIVQNQLNAQLGSARKARAGDYYILNRTPFPSILVECGFLSTPQEEALLVTSEYQQRVAIAIFSGMDTALRHTGGNREWRANSVVRCN